jgi:hypothetical protein
LFLFLRIRKRGEEVEFIFLEVQKRSGREEMKD